ncbi:MAG: DPP IV N-terminal domain-containing protein, partial [Planctomycetota bacterium]
MPTTSRPFLNKLPLRRAVSATLAAAGLLVASAPASAQRAEPHGGMLRFPDVSQDRIVFSYGNDLWTVERAGGVARPLASPPGQELFPKFSPDGQTIAFVGNYDGDRDLYLIDSFGGLAERLTYHPSNELLCDWAGDNRLLFSAGGRSHRPQPRQTRQLFFLDVDNPAQQEELPVPYGVNASLGEDG